jgi:hypothetical protein
MVLRRHESYQVSERCGSAVRVVVGSGMMVQCFEGQSSCELDSVVERMLVVETSSAVVERKFQSLNGDACTPFWMLMLFPG